MKFNIKRVLLLISIGIIIALLLTNSSNTTSNEQDNNENTIDIQDNPDLIPPQISGASTKAFIHINGNNPYNWTWTAGNYSWCYYENGYYIIENEIINAGGSGNGIFIENSKNVYFIIRNCTVYNAVNGIRLENTNNGTLISNNCSNNIELGICLYSDCENNTISKNIASINEKNGIYLHDECDDNTISGNFAGGNGENGIGLENSCNDNTISGNSAKNNGQNGIFLNNECYNNTISENEASRQLENGIDLMENCSDNTISGNLLISNKNGICLHGKCDNNTISENRLYMNSLNGIYLYNNCHYNFISRNWASDMDLFFQRNGIYLKNCDDNIISGNTVNYNEGAGIVLEKCDGNIISGNTMLNNIDGILLYFDCDGNIISENTVNNNLETGIYFSIECDYNIISGNTISSSRNGIFLESECNHNNVSGNTISSSRNGISLSNECDYNIISKNTANNNEFYGIYISSYGNIISENTANNNVLDGVMCAGYGNKVLGNTVTYNGRNGIRLGGGGNNISGNTITYNEENGIHSVYSRYNIISENTITHNWENGIYLKNCDDNLISGNNIESSDNYGIVLQDSKNNFIAQNMISTMNKYFLESGTSHNYYSLNLCDGVYSSIAIDPNGNHGHTWEYVINYFSQCSGTGTWSDPYILKNLYLDSKGVGCGILIQNSKNVYFVIQNCEIYNSGSGVEYAGIKLYKTNNGTLTNNYISDNNGHGILLHSGCENNTISGNTIKENGNSGIYFYTQCNNNVITENLIYNNNRGIEISENSNNNLLFYNFLFNNSNYNGYDDGQNNWDNGIIGNYWGTYTGIDANHDGIGDTPYDISGGNNKDNKPIMNYNPVILPPDDLSFEVGTTEHKITWIIVTPTPYLKLAFEVLYEGIPIKTGKINLVFNEISINIDALDVGTHVFTIEVENVHGGIYTDVVWVTVKEKIEEPVIPMITINAPAMNQEFGEYSLGFDISIEGSTIVSMWYTIDGGFTNITFTELIGIIDQDLWLAQPNGLIRIRFYAEDIEGDIGYADVIVIKDVEDEVEDPIIPIITINAPTMNQEFGKYSLAFDISIEGSTIISMWYTLDGGLTNTTFTELIDIIDPDIWLAQPKGLIRIRFYAEDIEGDIGHADVIVIKDVGKKDKDKAEVNTNEQSSSEPSGNQLLLLIGGISAIGGIILTPLIKKRLFK